MSLWKTSIACLTAARKANAEKPKYRIQKNGHGEYWAEEYTTERTYTFWATVLGTKTFCFEETERRLLNIMENRAKTANKQIVAEYYV